MYAYELLRFALDDNIYTIDIPLFWIPLSTFSPKAALFHSPGEHLYVHSLPWAASQQMRDITHSGCVFVWHARSQKLDSKTQEHYHRSESRQEEKATQPDTSL